MTDIELITDKPPLPAAEPPAPAADSRAALEERVRRLEDAVAEMQDTQKLEERVVERVAERINHPPAPSLRESAGRVVEAGRRLLPAAVAMMSPAAPVAAAPPTAVPLSTRQPWLVLDLYTEVRTMIGMFLDSRYRVSWAARTLPLIAVIFMGLSWLFLSGGIFGTVLDRVLELVLAFVAYKVLAREACHYRETVAHLPPYVTPLNGPGR